ncbi:universal stress protein [Deinococcus pimensis]|uniref:universal stress protein n=1 Tax=Deinococcus pimensis TaxID=309888 RepID=UPI000484285F|nr:universal stress protein [Deinococcus pimensis]
MRPPPPAHAPNGPFRRILVMMNFSPSARAALAAARRAFPHARLDVLHVVPVEANAASPLAPAGRGLTSAVLVERDRHWTHEAAARLAELGGGEIVRGDAGDVALERLREGRYDLVVVGASALGGVERLLLGSVATRLLRRSPVPVLTVLADPEG